MAMVILCGFGRVNAARLCYGTLINLPPGGLRVARRVTSLECRQELLSLHGNDPGAPLIRSTQTKL